MTSDKNAVKGFSVDTHILRELGLLLVGRDSTALLELVKNSYDAEATSVTLDAKGLGQPNGVITVTDDGNGMSYDRFVESFLRLAGRTKETDRDSPTFGRRFTGAKGIGRLAAHKLSAVLDVVSVPDSPSSGVTARLDWDAMENDHNNLSDVGDALAVDRLASAGLVKGTTMTLTELRGEWTPLRLGMFLDEIRKCRPNETLVGELPQAVVAKPVLFKVPKVRQHEPKDPGMSLELTGDLTPGDDLWDNLSVRADWVVEIAAMRGKKISYGIAPTKRKRDSIVTPALPQWATQYTLQADHPDPKNGPFFQARFFITEGTLGTKKSAFAEWARREAGISVFMEGFRVLPYGTNGDDWLELDRDAARKPRDYDIEIAGGDLDRVEREGFFQLGNRAYFGAVFLTDAGAPHLQAVVNREGFVPDAYFLTLRDIVRNGADLATRARAALERRVSAAKELAKAEEQRRQQQAARRAAEEAARKAAEEAAEEAARNGRSGTGENSDASEGDEGEGGSEDQHDPDDGAEPGDGDSDDLSDDDRSDSGNSSSREAHGGSQGHTWGPLVAPEDAAADERMERLITEMAATIVDLEKEDLDIVARTKVVLLKVSLEGIAGRARVLADEQLTLRTLAGVGTLYSAFVHEVNGLLGQSRALRGLVDSFPTDAMLSRGQRATLRDMHSGADELVQSLTRQASYLTEVVGPDSRRRRRRMPLAERVEIALRLLTPQISERSQRVEIDVAPEVTTPPIFAAELAIVLTNLLANATKFARDGGVIRVSGYLDDEMTLHLVVENSGEAVSRVDAERFFRPFESTTTEVNLVLGQGMGLGLPIVRNLLEGYDGTAAFATPSAGFATAVEIQLPDPRPDIARRRGAA